MAILLSKDSRIVIQGITGREATMVTVHTQSYGSPIVAGVTPGKGGSEVHGVPVYNTLKEAVELHQANTAVVYVPPAFVYDAVLEALENNIKLIYIATENVPQHDAIKFLNLARKKEATIIGPNSVGIISPGEKVKVGAIGGDNVTRCFVPGPVGVISRSGGMTAETSWMVKKAGYGVSTSVSIGGDALIGTSPVELLKMFEKDDETKVVVTFSEPGTSFEEDMAQFVKEGGFTKPLISFISGQFTESLPEGTVFGHAGAMIAGGMGKPSNKKAKLTEAGATVVEKFDDLIPALQKVLG
ncbi:MAG: CoA-binding protein [Bacillota bacterium]|nr:CoA-binding protein [Bacillota bacterium]